MHDNILLPVDVTNEASWDRALPAAKRQVASGGTIHLLGIVGNIGSSMVATFLPKDFEAKALEAMKDALDDFAARELDGDIHVETHVGHGHVAETILRIAEKLAVDLIVMSNVRPDTRENFAIGSQANAVVRHAPMSVMVVR